MNTIKESLEHIAKLADRAHASVGFVDNPHAKALNVASEKAAAALASLSNMEREPIPVSEQNARFAIDGAITYGRQGVNRPPEGHWLMEFWEIGRQLAAHPCASGKDAKDAARYRRLRDAENGGDLSVGKYISTCDEYPRYEQVDWLYGDELDTACDAAIDQAREGK